MKNAEGRNHRLTRMDTDMKTKHKGTKVTKAKKWIREGVFVNVEIRIKPVARPPKIGDTVRVNGKAYTVMHAYRESFKSKESIVLDIIREVKK